MRYGKIKFLNIFGFLHQETLELFLLSNTPVPSKKTKPNSMKLSLNIMLSCSFGNFYCFGFKRIFENLGGNALDWFCFPTRFKDLAMSECFLWRQGSFNFFMVIKNLRYNRFRGGSHTTHKLISLTNIQMSDRKFLETSQDQT